MVKMNDKLSHIMQWFLRIALSAAFLSAVADRFGLWGKPGAEGVAWGAWRPFVEYVALLNWFMPDFTIPFLAWTATIAELCIAVGLIIGWQLKWFALAAGLLSATFFTTMTIALGIKVPLDYSVFTVSAAAFYLAFTNSSKSKSNSEPASISNP